MNIRAGEAALVLERNEYCAVRRASPTWPWTHNATRAEFCDRF